MSHKIGGHCLHSYDEDLQSLHRLLSEMGDLVLRQLCQSLECVRKADLRLAEEVIHREREVNEFEIATDGEIFKILAKRCPVAGDLRFLIAASKIINNLERIGDEAAKLANFVMALDGDGHDPAACPLSDVCSLGETAVMVLCYALQAVADFDAARAKKISDSHGALNHRFKAALARLMSRPQRDAHDAGIAFTVVRMLKALQRVGDHAQNLGEYVIFETTGEDVRHTVPDLGRDQAIASDKAEHRTLEE